MVVKLICFKCGKEINPKGRFVSLQTFDMEELVHKVDFHIICWGDYNSQRLNEQLAKMYQMGSGILKNMGLNNELPM